FMPRGHAHVATLLAELIDGRPVSPPFNDSVFSTAEIRFCNAPAIVDSYKNYYGALDTMEVITSIGTYDYKKGGHIVFWDDKKIFELRSGGTVMFPAASKRYSFLPVAPNEKRFLFRQFCNGGALRWVEKGGRSDSDFEAVASEEELEAWAEKLAARGYASAKRFTKLEDILVL
ncbi:hypothetical protein B0H15DRAFT_787799, partial [Mycena belliarum]